MKRMMAYLGAMTLCATLAGCSTDPREGLINSAVQDLKTAATKVETINSKIKEAFDKNSTQYIFYRNGCGRDARLRQLWGAAAGID